MIISTSEYSRLVVIIECDPAVQGWDDLTVTCYFKNQHVSLKSFHTFSTLYPEINMLGEISKHFRFMETHVVRNHVNFQN